MTNWRHSIGKGNAIVMARMNGKSRVVLVEEGVMVKEK